MTQLQFQTIINNVVGEEIAVIGSIIYNTTDSTQLGMVKSYQIHDCVYKILSALPGLAATYFNFSVGDTRFDLNLLFIQEETNRALKERDRALNLVQNITPSDTTTDLDQPGYGQPASSVY
jgi:hypothetical protein